MRILVILFCCFVLHAQAQHPPRKAIMGIKGTAVTEGISIDSVFGGTMAELKLQKGDVITSLNDHPLTSLARFNQLAANLRAGDNVTVTYIRNKQKTSVKGKAIVRPFESSLTADVLYDWVAFRKGF